MTGGPGQSLDPGDAGTDETTVTDEARDAGTSAATDAGTRGGRRAYARGSALAGAAVGFGVWLVAPFVAGRAEPWDASYPLYSVALIGSGILLGLLGPRPRHLGWLTSWAGAWAGQVVALLALPWLEPAAISTGIVVTGLGSSLFVMGTAAGTLMGILARRRGR